MPCRTFGTRSGASFRPTPDQQGARPLKRIYLLAAGVAAVDPGPPDAVDREPTETTGSPVGGTATVVGYPLQPAGVDTQAVGSHTT